MKLDRNEKIGYDKLPERSLKKRHRSKPRQRGSNRLSSNKRAEASASVIFRHVMTDELQPLNARVMIDARYIRNQSSGIGRYTMRSIEQLLQLDDSLRLILLTHAEQPRPFVHPHIECRTFPSAANSLRTRFALSSLVDFHDVDLFHSPFNILPANLPVPAVFTLHDIMWLLDPAYCTDSKWRRAITGTFYRQLIPRSVHEASRIMTVSHHSREAIEAYFPEVSGRVHVTYNGLDSFFHPLEREQTDAILAPYIEPGRPFVLVVGQGSPYKNHAGALAGFIEAFRDDPEVAFVLIRRFSRGPATRLNTLMADPCLKDRLIHLPYVTGEELRAFYNAASVFLFPSLYEGFGLPALEAMACRTPVVTSNRGAPAEVCGEAAMRVDPESPAAIAQALRQLMNEPELYAQKQQEGIARAQQFSWENCARQMLETYRLALNA